MGRIFCCARGGVPRWYARMRERLTENGGARSLARRRRAPRRRRGKVPPTLPGDRGPCVHGPWGCRRKGGHLADTACQPPAPWRDHPELGGARTSGSTIRWIGSRRPPRARRRDLPGPPGGPGATPRRRHRKATSQIVGLVRSMLGVQPSAHKWCLARVARSRHHATDELQRSRTSRVPALDRWRPRSSRNNRRRRPDTHSIPTGSQRSYRRSYRDLPGWRLWPPDRSRRQGVC